MLKYRHRKYLFFNCPNETDRGVRINRYMQFLNETVNLMFFS
ncbi:hypothetical protein [Sulfurimonas sp.]|nr:hypothetical protein [Sulfurimonas sp.]